ncbi:10251_t:CDS:2 [Entrophospora sp. SA101]|nr:10251_t:CDS:2 [Entrophospora sp. SA101]
MEEEIEIVTDKMYGILGVLGFFGIFGISVIFAKWGVLGPYEIFGICGVFGIYRMSSFVTATTSTLSYLSDNGRHSLLTATIVLGAIHFTVEVRQFIWKPLKYTTDFWNYFDLGAYSLAIVTSILWLYYNKPPPIQLISASNLLLDLRLIFSHAFFLLLKPSQDVALDYPDFNDDTNNPWNLVNKYYTYFASNSSYNQDSLLVQQPDANTNMFAHFPSSILAMYNFLTDNGAFGAWELQKNSYLTLLVVSFSFIVVVYLMNLFIGLLGNEIHHYNTKEAFLAQKAKIIVKIELFYLFPNQRRWRNWFPDILYYNAPIDDIRKKIKKADDSNEGEEYLPYISDRLRELARVSKKTENGFDSRFQQIETKLAEMSNKTENDLRFQQIESNLNEIKNIIENNTKEMEKKMENKLNHYNNQLLIQMQILLNEIKNSKK